MTTQQAADRSGLPELDAECVRALAGLSDHTNRQFSELKCRERQLLAALKRIQKLESGELPEWVLGIRQAADGYLSVMHLSDMRPVSAMHRFQASVFPEKVTELCDLLSSSLQSNRELREQLATVLAREAATTKRYDDKLNSEKGGEK